MFVTSQTLLQLMVLDAPEHEDDRRDDGKDEGVGEMSVERQLDKIATKS